MILIPASGPLIPHARAMDILPESVQHIGVEIDLNPPTSPTSDRLNICEDLYHNIPRLRKLRRIVFRSAQGLGLSSKSLPSQTEYEMLRRTFRLRNKYPTIYVS